MMHIKGYVVVGTTKTRNRKRIALIASGYPGSSGGSMINMRTLIDALLSLGHTVTFIKLDVIQDSVMPSDLGVNVRQYRSSLNPVKLSFRPSHTDGGLTNSIQNFLFDEKVDLIILYGYEPLALLDVDSFVGCRKIILLGDPYHLVVFQQVKNLSLTGGWKLDDDIVRNIIRFLPRLCLAPFRNTAVFVKWYLITRRLKKFEWGYATAAHHAEWYRKFNKSIDYQPSPVIGPSVLDVNDLIEKRAAFDMVYILYMGHALTGTSNTAGMTALVNLTKKMCKGISIGRPWKLLIAGGYVTELLRNLFTDNEHVDFVGYVDLSNISAKVSVLLNVIPHRLGNRTRIASAFAYAIPTISHCAALYGMPSLRHENSGALVFENDEDCIRRLNQLLSDSVMYRKYALDARRSYEQLYSVDALAKKVVGKIG